MVDPVWTEEIAPPGLSSRRIKRAAVIGSPDVGAEGAADRFACDTFTSSGTSPPNLDRQRSGCDGSGA